MLWVTMMIVTRFFSSPMSDSMAWVAMGSRDDVGSSMSKISGSTANARAMQRRCYSPPDRVTAWAFMRVDTLSHNAAATRADSAASSSSDFFLMPLKRSPDTTLS